MGLQLLPAAAPLPGAAAASTSGSTKIVGQASDSSGVRFADIVEDMAAADAVAGPPGEDVPPENQTGAAPPFPSHDAESVATGILGPDTRIDEQDGAAGAAAAPTAVAFGIAVQPLVAAIVESPANPDAGTEPQPGALGIESDAASRAPEASPRAAAMSGPELVDGQEPTTNVERASGMNSGRAPLLMVGQDLASAHDPTPEMEAAEGTVDDPIPRGDDARTSVAPQQEASAGQHPGLGAAEATVQPPETVDTVSGGFAPGGGQAMAQANLPAPPVEHPATSPLALGLENALGPQAPSARPRRSMASSEEAKAEAAARVPGDSPRPVLARSGDPALRAGGEDGKGQDSPTSPGPRGGQEVDVSMLDVQVVQATPSSSGDPQGAAGLDAGEAAAAFESARPPAPTSGVPVSSLPLGEFARSFALSSYVSSVETPSPGLPMASTLGPFDTEPPHQQVVRAVRVQWANGVSEARLRLHPEHLGEVMIDLRVEHGRVAATLRLDNPAAAEWIRAQRAELQASLGAQGLDLGSLEIIVDPEGRRRRSAPPDQTTPARNRRRDAELPRFEVMA